MTITLEPFTSTDIDVLLSWIPSAAFLLQWAGSTYTYPLDVSQISRYLQTAQGEQPPNLMFKAVAQESGRYVGHCELITIDWRNRSARMSRILVGPQELRGQGLGGQIVRALLQIAFETLHLHRVDLGVFDFNQSAIACYKRVGLQTEGIMRESHRYENEHWNLCIMAMLEHEWRERSQEKPGF
ncbi:MAG: GNAT family protein [Candidatus Vecturithrix sp.]|jgi:RimJ/RimL family protein N-acetyltransferase|nr:GNAT family protein [Candidatus Vecturithrix sp.]